MLSQEFKKYVTMVKHVVFYVITHYCPRPQTRTATKMGY